jgi:carbohydrate kinase (thermoresistant glucokinase family)
MKAILVVMGVSGCGKTTVAAMLAGRLGTNFLEGDELHPPANVEKMRGGTPLTDEDRWPWLEAIARVIDEWRMVGEGGVVTCSALKRAYRRVIVGDRREVSLAYLKGSPELIQRRMAARHEHFMPVALLESQFKILEEPGIDERPIVADVSPPPAEIAASILRELERRIMDCRG